jgi:hypothetical protein
MVLAKWLYRGVQLEKIESGFEMAACQDMSMGTEEFN